MTLRLPKLFNLRSDPFETADHEGMDYDRWRIEHVFVLVPAQQYVGRFLDTFKEFPPSQKPGSFSLDQVLEALQRGATAATRPRRRPSDPGRAARERSLPARVAPVRRLFAPW